MKIFLGVILPIILGAATTSQSIPAAQMGRTPHQDEFVKAARKGMINSKKTNNTRKFTGSKDVFDHVSAKELDEQEDLLRIVMDEESLKKLSISNCTRFDNSKISSQEQFSLVMKRQLDDSFLANSDLLNYILTVAYLEMSVNVDCPKYQKFLVYFIDN
jgi:hypothetical protein